MDTQRLKPIQQIAESREQSRAKVFAERGRALDAQQKRLDELAQYAREYAQPAQSGSTVTASMLQNRSAFLDRLDDAVRTQSKAVDKAKENVELERARLLLASREVAMLDKLADSYAVRERHVEAQRLQKELDDHALRGHRGPGESA
ncbi:MAG: flagellar biosynthesis chaperone [Alphaproteobacteria bacterium ADurb.BinA280]|jgi:flagellar protein FliJ|nr:flagellar export protein FliJ [Xanthomonadales bacterium]MCC6505260.1 flagellar export protein FliJ [Aquimonas sp.]OPZ13586.1 MAG: flagellar biosynthesis chaperone [Alphaproteobacteria bacterium ADurb.BinA280]